MNELEKAAEKREIEICQYATKDCLSTNDCHRCQWGVPSLDLRCSNNASFKLGAQWQARQSPWISVEDRLPDVGVKVFTKTKNGNYILTSMYIPADCKGNVLGPKEWRGSGAFKGSITHWMPIPE